MVCIKESEDATTNADGSPHNRDARADHASEDCFDVSAHAPIVQSTVNGVKVCANPAKSMAFAQAI